MHTKIKAIRDSRMDTRLLLPMLWFMLVLIATYRNLLSLCHSQRKQYRRHDQFESIDWKRQTPQRKWGALSDDLLISGSPKYIATSAYMALLPSFPRQRFSRLSSSSSPLWDRALVASVDELSPLFIISFGFGHSVFS
jgi:hypothetical protein